jgi:hypothetical protein
VLFEPQLKTEHSRCISNALLAISLSHISHDSQASSALTTSMLIEILHPLTD